MVYLLLNLALQFQSHRHFVVAERSCAALAPQHHLNVLRSGAWNADALQLQMTALVVALVENGHLILAVHKVDQRVLELTDLAAHIVQLRIAFDLVDRSVVANWQNEKMMLHQVAFGER